MFLCPYERAAIHQQVMIAQKITAGGGSAPTRGNSTLKQGGGTTAGITTTGGTGSVMLVFIGSSSSDNPTIADNKGNTWGTHQYSVDDATSGDRMRCWALYNGTGGSGHTITESGGGGADIIVFVEYTGATGFELPTAGLDSSAPFEIATSGATTVANSMIVSQGSGTNVAGTTTHSCTPYTKFIEEQDYNTYWAFGVGDGTVSSTGVKTATWSFSPTAGTSAPLGIIVVKGT